MIKTIIYNSFLSVLILTLSLASGPASAAVLSLSPASSTIQVGQAVGIDINVSGLGNHTATSIAAFEVEIGFDTGILGTTAASVSFGSLLNGGDPFGSIQDAAFIHGPNLLDVSELSLLSDIELDPLQPDSFTLATLTFQGVGLGTSSLSFNFVELTDTANPANLIAVDPPQTASITVIEATPTIPEPMTVYLMLSGLAWLRISSRRNG